MNFFNTTTNLGIRVNHSLFASLTAFLFLLGCGKESKQGPAATAPVEVSTMIIEPKNVPVSFEFVAQTQSSHLVNIQARVNGFLDKRVYTEGEFVKKDQVLFIMDKKPFQAQVDAANAALARQKAALEVAKRNLDRVKPLSEQNALSQKDLDDATGSYLTNGASVEQAKAQLETSLLNLSYCTISSPIDGITSSALQQEGTYLSMSDNQLTTVAALSPIWVNFSLSENQIQDFRNQVAKGQLLNPPDDNYEVEVIQVDGTVFPHSGKITFNEPYFNPQTGTFLIRASVDNPKGVLRPNQYVRANVKGAIRPNAILIPQRAVQESAKGHFVWVVDKEGVVDVRPVAVGDWHESDWFITSGLNKGDEVVVDGALSLHSGQSVKIKRESSR